MSGLVLATVMPAIATALTGAGIVERAYYRPTEAIKPKCAVVGYPEDEVDFDVTFGNGLSHATFPVWIVLGLQQDEATFTDVSALINSSAEVKAAIEASTTLTNLGAVFVSGALIEAWNLAANPDLPTVHTAVKFTVEVTA